MKGPKHNADVLGNIVDHIDAVIGSTHVRPPGLCPWQNPEAITELPDWRVTALTNALQDHKESGSHPMISIHREHCQIVKEGNGELPCTCVITTIQTGAVA